MCKSWAELGECDKNVEYMKLACPVSCEEAKEIKAKILKEVEAIKSIHELSAKDIDGNEVNFDDFAGHVIVFVNVIASDNPMSEAHYKGLVELQEKLKGQDVRFLLFPTEQFIHPDHDTLPTDKDDLIAYFTNKGLMDEGTMFTIMETIKVNGPDAHIVYKFAKYDAVPHTPGIPFNFDPYFIVHPKGDLEARHRHHPEHLFEPIMEHFGSSEL
eukprot:scaffold1962_cov162-Amphora_coffeaeformis.AAC.1